MKKSIILLFLLVFSFSYSQNGKIKLKDSNFKPGKENIYVYEVPSGIVIPNNSLVSAVYSEKEDNSFKNKYYPLIKNGTDYEFTAKVSDSTNVIFLVIVDSKNKTVDNNAEKGYIIYLNNKTKEEDEKAKLNQLKLSNYSNYILNLKITPEEIITEYEALFKQNPQLMETDNYLNYLYLKFRINKEETSPKLIQYAQKAENKNTEKDLNTAYDIYSTLKNKLKATELKQHIIANYPTGEIAKYDFLSSFFSTENPTESYILESLKNYVSKFNDNSQERKELFYSKLLSIYLKNKDLQNIEKYENLITNKLTVALKYNDFAWGLSGQDLTTPAKDIDFAEKISKQSLDFVKEKMKNPSEDDNMFRLQGDYNQYADTYALILYKQKKYDLAFQFQDEISKLDGLDTGGKERYAGFAEKVKGLDFTRDYLETQLKSGVDSKIMLDQLQEIYTKLNLPKTEYEKIKGDYLAAKAKKTTEELKKNNVTVKAIDFTLTNLEGKKIKLSDYKGKVVVLDFWATWCAPCRASFPGMQELVTKYKNDKIEFFFVDVWERGEPKETQESVTKFISDHKYSFNVLYDFNDEIVSKYNIQGVPSKIVIDKEGNIVSSNYFISHDNLIALIEESLKK